MSHPLTSIVIPAYNAKEFIEETINSVIQQSYKNWELIIIDDGSTDNTPELIKPYLSDDRISYFHQENKGVSEARNHGISKSKGEFIAFLDADDIWRPNKLEANINILNSNEDVGFVFSDMGAIDRYSKKLNDPPKGKSDQILQNILLWNGEVIPGPCSNLVVRKKIIEMGHKFDPKFSTAADQDFCIQISSNFKGYRIPEILWDYRLLETSMSRNLMTMEKDHIGVFKKAKKNKLFQSYSFEKKCFSNLFLILGGSWWVDGNNKKRALYFLAKSILTYPPIVFKLITKKPLS